MVVVSTTCSNPSQASSSKGLRERRTLVCNSQPPLSRPLGSCQHHNEAQQHIDRVRHSPPGGIMRDLLKIGVAGLPLDTAIPIFTWLPMFSHKPSIFYFGGVIWSRMSFVSREY